MEIIVGLIFTTLLGFIFGAVFAREKVNMQGLNSIKNFSDMKNVIKTKNVKRKPKICDDDAMVIKEREL